MIGRVYFADDVLDFAFFINDNRGPDNAHVFFTVHRFFAPSAELLDDLVSGIGDKGEWEFEFGDEFLVTGSGVGTDTDNFKAVFTQQRIVVTEVAGFCRTTWGVVLGVEENNQFAPLEILETEFMVVLVKACERRRFAPGFKCVHDR